MIHAQHEKLPMSQFNDGGMDRDLYAFRARKPDVAAAATLKVNEIFDRLGSKVNFEIISAKDPTKPPRETKVNAYSKPKFNVKDPKDLVAVRIVISSELLAPLLKPGLPVAEALVQQFFVAKTVSHNDW